MKIVMTDGTVPTFRQIATVGDDGITGLDEYGRVWIFVPASSTNPTGWCKLPLNILQRAS